MKETKPMPPLRIRWMALAISAPVLGLAGSFAHAESAVLRISCEGPNADAQVFVNGKLKGECPLDMEVPAGRVRLMARKPHPWSAEFDNVWEQEINVGDGVVKKLSVDLNHPHYGQKKRDELAPRAAETLRKAEAGDMEAMKQMSSNFHEGIGVSQDDAKARGMLERWVATGSAEALRIMAIYHLDARMGYPADRAQATRLLKKAAALGDAFAPALLDKLGE